MEVEELIQKVKDDDLIACKEMIDMFHKMICSIINDYNLNLGDYLISFDDLYQEALIGLYEACKNYRYDKNTRFSTFVYVVVKRKVQRFYNQQFKKYINESLSIDKFEQLDHLDSFKTNYVYDNPLSYLKEEEFKNGLNNFNDLDRQIIKLRLENYSYLEIAEKLKIDKKKVDNRLYRLKARYLKNQ